MVRDSPFPQVAQLCLAHLLKFQAAKTPGAIALEAPDRSPLTYGHLNDHLETIAFQLRQLGIKGRDRVAILLPNGPEMITAFLSVSSCATSVVLNPALHHQELRAYLPALQVKAILVETNTSPIVRDIAQTHRIEVIEICPTQEATAGIFTVVNHAGKSEATVDVAHDIAQPNDIALVLLTSGTTAQPKQVPITQANLCTSALRVCNALHLNESDRCLNIMPTFHSHGLIGAAISSLISGGTLICPPGFYAARFFEWLEIFAPSWYTAVPTLHQSIVTRGKTDKQTFTKGSLRFIRSSSAPLPSTLATALEQMFNVSVIQTYGLTEAFQITCNPCPPYLSKPGSVGRPESPEDIAILDSIGNTLPTGETGEIAIHRQKVIHGYENNPTANQAAFTKNWFKTGDQGFLDADGFLFITGRLKEIINRGGEQISPYEIEDVILDHPNVEQAVAFAVPDPQLGEDIAVAIVVKDEAVMTPNDIRQWIARELADFKLPAQVVFLDDIPKGSSGKPQRIGLAERLGITQSHPQEPVVFIAPRTPVEQKLVAIWQEILGREQIGVHDPFYRSGGDSILATLCLSRIRDVFQVELSFVDFFEEPTIAGVAQLIEQQAQKQDEPAIEKSRRDSNLIYPSALNFVKSVTDSRMLSSGADLESVTTRPYPLSIPQQQQWFLEQLKPDGPTYNLSAAYRLSGQLNLSVLEHSLKQIVRRHHILSARFSTIEGKPVQYIAPHQPLSLTVIDLSDQPKSEQTVQVQAGVNQEGQRSFNLEQGPLLRAVVWKLDEAEHVFLVCGPHMVLDGWSRGVLIQELSVLYRAFLEGDRSPLPELPIQYTDFAGWQRRQLEANRWQSHLQYWTQQLSDPPAPLELWTHRPRSPVPTFNGTCHTWMMPKSLGQRLQDLSQREGVTLYVTLLAVYKVMLHYHTGHDDIIVGSPFANRTRAETERLIGFLAHTLPLRTRLGDNPRFRKLLQEVQKVAVAGWSHPELALEQLMGTLRGKRNGSYAPIFQAVFVLLDPKWRQLALPSLNAIPLAVNTAVVQCDLTLFMERSDQGLLGTLEYNTGLFDHKTIIQMSTHLERLLLKVSEQSDIHLNELTDMLKEVDVRGAKEEEKEYQRAKLNRLKSVRRKSAV